FGWAVRDREARRAEAARQEATRKENLEQEIRRALKEVEEAVQQDRLPAAIGALQRAEWLLSDGGVNEQLQLRVHHWRSDLDLAGRLAEFRLLQADAESERESADPGFADVFRQYGLKPGEFDAEQSAERIRESAIRDLLVAGLHDWARWDYSRGGRYWKNLLAFSGKADPYPWRDQIREAVRVQDATTLQQRAGKSEVLAQHPTTALLL